MKNDIPSSIASSIISLKRCESNFGSEQIIEQKSLTSKQLEVKDFLFFYSFLRGTAKVFHSNYDFAPNLRLPVHIALQFYIEVFKILLF